MVTDPLHRRKSLAIGQATDYKFHLKTVWGFPGKIVFAPAPTDFVRRTLWAILPSFVLVVAAEQPATSTPYIELSLGETAYVHLTSTTPTGKPVAAIRVENPNRDHSIVKVTFEANPDDGKHRLRVRNGYENPVFFSTLCPRPVDGILPPRVLIGTRPGRESSVEMPLSMTRLSLCDFTVSIGPVG